MTERTDNQMTDRKRLIVRLAAHCNKKPESKMDIYEALDGLAYLDNEAERWMDELGYDEWMTGRQAAGLLRDVRRMMDPWGEA